MTNSWKKSTSNMTTSRPTTAGTRSASVKKSTNASKEIPDARSRSTKKKPSWDDTNHDLSVHKLPMKKLLEKQLQMMSKETLCKIAGIEAPVRGRATLRDEILSPPLKKVHARRTSEEFHSPQASGEENHSSAASTPESIASDANDESSIGSTPSPRERKQAAAAAAKPQQPFVHVAKPIVKKPSTTMTVAPVPAEPVTSIVRRRSAALTTTTAPPTSKQQQQQEEVDYSLSLASSSTTPSTTTDLTYSPWLKPDSLLSPVLERSIETSIAASPEIQRALQTEVGRGEKGGMEQQKEDEEEQGRNLLQELRTSLAADTRSLTAVTSSSSSTRIPSELAELMTKLSQHLSEQPEKQRTEKAFKATIVESFTQAAQQVKQLQARVEEVESENRTLRHMLQQQRLEEERREQLREKQWKLMELKVEQMWISRQTAVAQPTPVQSQAQQASTDYNPSLYHSGRSQQQREETMQPQQQQQHIVFPSNLPSTLPSSSSSFTVTPYTPAPTNATAPGALAPPSALPSHSPTLAPRASSPPRPIVIGGGSTMQVNRIQSMQGQRMSEVAVALKGNVPMINTLHRNQPHQVQPVQPTTKVAWQTYAANGQQQQQAPRPQPVQHSPIRPSPAAFRSTAISHDASFNRDMDEDEDDDMEEVPRASVALRPSPLGPSIHSAAAPLSPGEEEEAAEAARFEREAAQAKARIASFNGVENAHQQQQRSMQTATRNKI